MSRHRLALLSVFSSVALVVAAVATRAEPPAASHGHGGPDSEYTLLQVMQLLDTAEGRIQHGLLTSNRLLIERGAAEIVDHPKPKGGIRPYIKKPQEGLDEMIKNMDGLVHENARKLHAAAATGKMSELHAINSEITRGCIGCHAAFRD